MSTMWDAADFRDVQPPLDPESHRPDWADRRTVVGGSLTYLVRVCWFSIMPFVAVLIAIFVEQYLLLATILLITLFSGGLGKAGEAIDKHPLLGKIPLVGDALRTMESLRNFYFEHRPFWFVTYLLAPILWPLGVLFSSRIRKEARLYGGIFLTLFVAMILESMVSYPSTYPPHLDASDAVGAVAAQAFFAVFLIMCYFIPTATTHISYSLVGVKGPRLFLVLLSILSAVPGLIFYYGVERSPVSFMATQLMDTRFEKPEFQADLAEATEMFFAYHAPRVASVAPSTAITEHAELTVKYRQMLDGYLTEGELNGFSILEVPSADGPAWLAVRVRRFNEIALLYGMADPDGTTVFAWADVPPSVAQQFRVAGADQDSWEVNDDLSVIEVEALAADFDWSEL